MIEELLNIVSGSRIPYVSGGALTMDQTRLACHNYAVVAFDCEDALVVGVGFGADISWNAVAYSDLIEKEVNAKGEEHVFYHRKSGRLSFNAIVDEATLDRIHRTTLQDNIILTEWANGLPGTSWQIFDMQIDVTASQLAISVTISFSAKDAETIISGCCGSPYDDPGYEPCPLPPLECIGFAVAITSSGSLPAVSLMADMTAAPGTVPTTMFTWFQDINGTPVQIGSGLGLDNILVTVSGNYSVTAYYEPSNCGVSDLFLIADDCGSLTMTAQLGAGIISTDPSISGGTFAWYFEGEDCNGTTPEILLPETWGAIAASEQGTYRVVYTLPGCSVQQLIVIAGCHETLIITRVGDDITANLSACCEMPGDVSDYVNWYIDRNDGMGFVLLPGALLTRTVVENGIYKATADCSNNCAAGVVQDEICIFYLCAVIVGINTIGGGTQLQAVAQNCTTPTYSWEQNIGPLGWETFVGTGQGTDTITPTNQGYYRVTALCADACQGESEIQWFPPSAAPPQIPSGLSQLFTAAGEENTFQVTAFILDDLFIGDPVAVDAAYAVYRNGIRIYYADPAIGVTQWQYDPASLITVDINFPLFLGDWLLIVKL